MIIFTILFTNVLVNGNIYNFNLTIGAAIAHFWKSNSLGASHPNSVSSTKHKTNNLKNQSIS